MIKSQLRSLHQIFEITIYWHFIPKIKEMVTTFTTGTGNDKDTKYNS